MNKSELLNRLRDVEWEDFEAKEAGAGLPKDAWETVSAFSNTGGGWLVFGVKKEGKNYVITGVGNPAKVESDFLTVLRGSKFNHKIIPRTEKYDFDGKTVLAFYFQVSEKKPVFFNSLQNTFIRTGSGDQRATTEEINAMLRDSAFGTKDREKTRFSIKSLDAESIREFRTYLKNIDPENKYNTYTDEKLLEKLGAIADGRATIAGLLAFGNEDSILAYFPDFRVDYLEIMGTSYSDAPTRYEFRLQEEKNLYQYFFSIYTRLIKKIDIPFKLKGAFRDENQPQVKAIREALVNLLIHSDYFSPAKPRIRVFLDRIEFFNPGALPKPLDKIRKEDISLPRNPAITRIFRAIKLAENAGYGFDKMFSGWKSYYGIEPVIYNDIEHYSITFYFGGKKITTPVTPPITTPVTPPSELTELETRILETLKNNPTLSRVGLVKSLGIKIGTVKEYLKRLRGKKMLKRIGGTGTGYWEVKK